LLILGGIVAAYLKAVLLAIVEGATEFLPVSSTGHLILVESFIDLTPDESFNKAFMIVIQLPAILAVLVYFRRDLWPFESTGALRRDRFVLWGKVFVAVLPALALGPFLDDFLEARLFAPVPVAIALLVGGVILIAVERRTHTTRFETVPSIPLLTALYIGLFQCLAMIPGTSRSAATIVGAMVLGASRPAAAEFSFFLAVPTLFAATVYSLFKHGLAFSGQEWGLLAVGSAVSFLVAYAAIVAFMTYIRRRSFAAFGIYRIVLAGIVLAAAMFGWIN
jgi:undecaprenyl-diphosphatase